MPLYLEAYNLEFGMRGFSPWASDVTFSFWESLMLILFTSVADKVDCIKVLRGKNLIFVLCCSVFCSKDLVELNKL